MSFHCVKRYQSVIDFLVDANFDSFFCLFLFFFCFYFFLSRVSPRVPVEKTKVKQNGLYPTNCRKRWALRAAITNDRRKGSSEVILEMRHLTWAQKWGKDLNRLTSRAQCRQNHGGGNTMSVWLKVRVWRLRVHGMFGKGWTQPAWPAWMLGSEHWASSCVRRGFSFITALPERQKTVA